MFQGGSCKSIVIAILATFFIIFSTMAIGMVLSENQQKALALGIKQLEKERDEAREAAQYWYKKAQGICT